MHTHKLFKLIAIVTVVTMLGNLMLPFTVQAKPLPAVHPASTQVVNSGKVFMTAVPEAMGNALHLAQLLDYISQTNLNDLDEDILVQARQHALTTAQQSAIAQGAVGSIANGMREMDLQHIQDAADVDDLVADMEAHQGFDDEIKTELANVGLSAEQIATLETQAADNFTVRRTGLTTETVTALEDAGLTDTEINQLEQALANYGLADNTLADRLDQFKASQQELDAVHTEALVAYLQLLVKQVFLRQVNGQPAREMTATEIDALVQDQLRLLIHLGYLDNLGSAPDAGEGQWLFIERYSLRVVERLDAMVLETQNVGLVVDLFVALQIHGTALAALNGDLAFGQAEITSLADLLETMLGDNLPGGQQARYAVPPVWWESTLAMGKLNPAEWVGYEPPLQAEAVAVAQEQVQNRVRGLASPLWSPRHSGLVDEYDETNNQDINFFYTDSPDLPPGLMDLLMAQGEDVLGFLGGALTGNTDNGWAIGANVVLGFWPITGIIVDYLGLIYAPGEWEAAFAMIGLVVSLITDGAEALGAIAALVPESLAATVPGTIAIEVLDAGASVLKNARHFVSSNTLKLLRKIPYDTVLKRVAPQLLYQLADKAVKKVGVANWPTGNLVDKINQVLAIIDDVLHSVWDPFVALLANFDGNIFKLFDNSTVDYSTGGYLAGRILHLSDNAADYGDEAIVTIAKIGDELAEEGIELSDDAAQGLGKLTRSLPGDRAKRVLDGICPAVAQISSYRGPGLASPLYQVCDVALFDNVLTTIKQWDDTALQGFEKAATAGVDDDTLAKFLIKYADDAPTSNSILSIVGESGITWSKQSFDSLVAATDDFGIEVVENIAQKYGDDIVERTFDVFGRTTANLNATRFEKLADVVDTYDSIDADGFLEIIDQFGSSSAGADAGGAIIDDLADLAALRRNSSAIDLIEQEALGSHSIGRHGPRWDMDDMRQRVQGTHPVLPKLGNKAFRFSDAETMNKAVNEAFRNQEVQIRAFFEGGNNFLGPKDLMPYNYGSSVGQGVIKQGSNIIEIPPGQVTKVQLTFIADDLAPDGFRLVSAYPEMN